MSLLSGLYKPFTMVYKWIFPSSPYYNFRTERTPSPYKTPYTATHSRGSVWEFPIILYMDVTVSYTALFCNYLIVSFPSPRAVHFWRGGIVMFFYSQHFAQNVTQKYLVNACWLIKNPGCLPSLTRQCNHFNYFVACLSLFQKEE